MGIWGFSTVSCPKCHTIVHMLEGGSKSYKELNETMYAHILHSCKAVTKDEAKEVVRKDRQRVRAIEIREEKEKNV